MYKISGSPERMQSQASFGFPAAVCHFCHVYGAHGKYQTQVTKGVLLHWRGSRSAGEVGALCGLWAPTPWEPSMDKLCLSFAKAFLITILFLCTGVDFSPHDTLGPNEEDLGGS